MKLRAWPFLVIIIGALALPLSQARRGEHHKYLPSDTKGKDFDALDGHGASKIRVDVIEWASNLELHIYPKKALAGLGLTIDRRKKNKPVMVIAYRFHPRFLKDPKKIYIRRAILGIALNNDFQVYRDPTVESYDKVIITNHELSGNLLAMKLDEEPHQLYPDGHPANKKLLAQKKAPPAPTSARKPAQKTTDYRKNIDQETGTIKSKSW